MNDSLIETYDSLRQDANELVGELSQLDRRAIAYRELYLASGRNHVFPLIAAHGALWAGDYFRWGLRLAKVLSWQYIGRPLLRQRQLHELDMFADAFREINRRVCADTYVNYHLTRIHGDHSRIGDYVPRELLAPLLQVHAANASGRELSATEKRMVYEAHFRHEQTHIVGPAVNAAVDSFDWPLVRALALRPRVRFAYFPIGTQLWFRNFANADERIENGLRAFEVAVQVGWDQLFATLQSHPLMTRGRHSQHAMSVDMMSELPASLLGTLQQEPQQVA